MDLIINIICILSVHSSLSSAYNPNISFAISSIKLPIPLTNHITSTYNNKFHILGGINADTSTASTNNYVLSADEISNQHINHTNDTTEIYPSTVPSIICDGQCSTTIGNKIYILQMQQIDYDWASPYMYIWNMDTNSYEASPMNLVTGTGYEPYIERFFSSQTLCVLDVNGNPGFIANIDKTYHEVIYGLFQNGTQFIGGVEPRGFPWNLYNLFVYNIVDDIWNETGIEFNTDRDNFGCTMINNSLYVMGGKYTVSKIEAQFIEKCDASDDRPGYGIVCEPIGYMDQRRSHLLLTS